LTRGCLHTCDFSSRAIGRKKSPFCRAIVVISTTDGAGRTRTGDLLAAISALAWPELGLTSGLPSLWVSSPNTFPNTPQPVLR
jgi:hypothetical protein